MTTDPFRALSGAATCVQELNNLIGEVRQQTCAELILNERGTGRVLVARTIHLPGPRGKKQFAQGAEIPNK
jgi:DNA-binding NtrC family response regulator